MALASASILDVARIARVSASTVSNVLNGRHGRMRPATLARVEAAMEELGYSPNGAARQLKSGQVRILGLILPSVANPFWGQFAREVERAALGYGYKVMLCNADRNPLHERTYAETLLATGVRGVILGSSPLSFEHFAKLARQGLLFASFDREPRGLAADEVVVNSVGCDNVKGGYLATRHLLGLGHRRIGFISGAIRTMSRHDRFQGFGQAMAEAGLEVDPDLVYQGADLSVFGDHEGAELGREGAQHLLGRPGRPTALVAINDLYAVGAMAGARDMGLSVPHDVSIIGYDGISLGELMDPPLTTIAQPLVPMTQTLVTMIVGRLEGTYAQTADNVTAVPQLVIRRSTAAPP